MKTSSTCLRSLLAILAITFCALVTAQAQTVINSLPYTIANSGLYVLNSNLNSSATSGSLISINASNVTLDMQGHYIAGPVGNTTQSTIGISATERSNLTIKNGTVAYCSIGILLQGNGTATTNNVDEQVDNMRITYCYVIGVELAYAPSSRITNCQVSQIGYSTNTYYPAGIYVVGAGVTVQNNAVSNITASSGVNTACIYVDTGSFVRQNQVSNAQNGVVYGIYQDNLAHACTTAFSLGVDGGGNTHD